MERAKIRNFNDLVAWKEAHSLVLLIYSMTRTFPSDEKFGLTNQIRRAAISTSSNIAEGFGRQAAKEKIQFYHVANGSLLEIKSQLFAAKDLKFISEDDFIEIYNKIDRTQSVLQGLIKSAQSRSF